MCTNVHLMDQKNSLKKKKKKKQGLRKLINDRLGTTIRVLAPDFP